MTAAVDLASLIRAEEAVTPEQPSSEAGRFEETLTSLAQSQERSERDPRTGSDADPPVEAEADFAGRGASERFEVPVESPAASTPRPGTALLPLRSPPSDVPRASAPEIAPTAERVEPEPTVEPAALLARESSRTEAALAEVAALRGTGARQSAAIEPPLPKPRGDRASEPPRPPPAVRVPEAEASSPPPVVRAAEAEASSPPPPAPRAASRPAASFSAPAAASFAVERSSDVAAGAVGTAPPRASARDRAPAEAPRLAPDAAEAPVPARPTEGRTPASAPPSAGVPTRSDPEAERAVRSAEDRGRAVEEPPAREALHGTQPIRTHAHATQTEGAPVPQTGAPLPSPAPDPLAAVSAALPPTPAASAAAEPLATPPAEAIPLHVEWLAARGGGAARVRLHPPELGEIELAVRVRHGAVQVVIRAQEPAAQRQVAEGRVGLIDALAARDLRVESFQVLTADGELRSEGAGRESGPDHSREEASDGNERRPGREELERSPPPVAEESAAASAPRPATGGGPSRVDLHV